MILTVIHLRIEKKTRKKYRRNWHLLLLYFFLYGNILLGSPSCSPSRPHINRNRLNGTRWSKYTLEPWDSIQDDDFFAILFKYICICEQFMSNWLRDRRTHPKRVLENTMKLNHQQTNAFQHNRKCNFPFTWNRYFIFTFSREQSELSGSGLDHNRTAILQQMTFISIHNTAAIDSLIQRFEHW